MPVPGGEITTTEILVPEVVPVEETTEEEASEGQVLYYEVCKTQRLL